MLTTASLAGAGTFLAVTLGVTLLGYLLLDRKSGDRRRVADRLRALSGTAPVESPSESSQGVASAIAKLGAMVVSGERVRLADLRTRLLHAGYARESALSYYLGLRLIFVVAIAAAVAIGSMFYGVSAWQKILLWSIAGGALGFILPTMILSSRLRKRQAILRASLPDALDVMVMCVESGSSLNASLQFVTEEIQDVHPLLGSEFTILQHEVQLGLSTGEAFRSFADRSGISDVRDLAAVLLRSEQYGASVAKALRSYVDQARFERQAWSEEMANKAAVKIVFPTLLCIFPAMFIVLLGPAAVHMAKLFAR